MNAAMSDEGEEVARVVAEEQRAEHGDRFGGDGEQEPGAVDAGSEAGLVVAEHDGDQRGVHEERPTAAG